MNKENLGYLKDSLKFHGFGDKLNGELEANIKDVKKDFTLSVSTEYNKDKVSALLHFRKSSESDLYFFNKYEAKLEKPGEPARAQTIYINGGKGMTMKESYNLLDGRAVYKEFKNQDDEKYKAWVQLDLDGVKDKNNNYEMKAYYQRYGYDLRESLSYFPIKELNNPDDRQNLVRSVERGNLQQVTIERDGVKEAMQIAADPKTRSIKFYDKDGIELSRTERNELMLEPEIRRQRQEERLEQEPGGHKKSSLAAGAVQEGGIENAGEKTTAIAKERENGQESVKEKNEAVGTGKEISQDNANGKVQATEKGKEKGQKEDKGQKNGRELTGKVSGNGLLEKKRTDRSKGHKIK